MTPTAANTPADPGASAESSKETGRAARRRVARSELGAWKPPADRRDPIDILQQQAKTRVPELVPIRYARMAHRGRRLPNGHARLRDNRRADHLV